MRLSGDRSDRASYKRPMWGDEEFRTKEWFKWLTDLAECPTHTIAGIFELHEQLLQGGNMVVRLFPSKSARKGNFLNCFVLDCMFTKETLLYEIKTFSCMSCYSQFFC